MFDIETEESDLDIEGQRVDVYRNDHEDYMSIQHRGDTDDENYGNVIGHADLVLLEDVEFVIKEGGQERTREAGVKNPHAVVRGTVVGVDMDGEIEWNLMVRMFDNDMCNINYNPYEMDAFSVMDAVRTDDHDLSAGDSVDRAVYASVTEEGVGAILPANE